MNRSKTRCEIIGEYIVKTETTVRNAAQKFGISKSTVHKDVTGILKEKNVSLYDSVREILDRHKEERHIRGGEATRQKYLACKETHLKQ